MQPIKTGILSFGMSGRLFHAPFVHLHSGFTFSAVWERSKQLAQQYYPAVASYQTLNDLLADDSIELIIVNTPNYTHCEYAKAALQAGKHVVVEKPFVTDVAQGEDLVALAKSANKILSVYQNRRYDSDYRTVKRIVDEEWLGEMVEAEFHFDRYKQELSPKVHKEVPGPGTGALYDLGSHIIDQALQLFGMPQAVFADIRTVRPVSQVDDYFELLLYYPSLRVRLHSSYLVREQLPGYILHGSLGSFIKAKTNVQEEALDKGIAPIGDDWGVEPQSEHGLLHTERDGEIIRKIILSESGNYTDYFSELYAAIRDGAPAPVTAGDGLNVIRIIEAAFQSSNEKRVVEL